METLDSMTLVTATGGSPAGPVAYSPPFVREGAVQAAPRWASPPADAAASTVPGLAVGAPLAR